MTCKHELTEDHCGICGEPSLSREGIEDILEPNLKLEFLHEDYFNWDLED